MPSDIDFLIRIENDESLWKYSNTKEPYSRAVLQTYIENSKEDFFTAKQQRFVLVDTETNIYGLIDLFDYDHQNATASIGIVIATEWRRKGYGKKGLKLLQKYAVNQLNLCQNTSHQFENKTLFLNHIFLINQNFSGAFHQIEIVICIYIYIAQMWIFYY